MRLDTFEGATDFAIVPKDADGSDVIDRITTDDEDLRMPPAHHAEALKPAEIKLLRTWIDQGAQYAVLQSGGYQDEAEVNQDGVVDFLNIGAFLTVLLSQ